MKILLCIGFLIFYSNFLYCQQVEEVVVIEKIEDNIANPIDSLYFLETRKNSLKINKGKRHFLHQSADELQINKAQTLGNALGKDIDTLGQPQKFSAIFSGKMQFMIDSHSSHFGFINTDNFQMYAGLLTETKEQFYTVIKPTLRLSDRSKIFFPFTFNYNYKTFNEICWNLGIGYEYEYNNFCITTTVLPVLDFYINDFVVSGGVKAVNQLKWKDVINYAEFSVTNKELSLTDTFSFIKSFFSVSANCDFLFKYYLNEVPSFSMRHSFTTAFNFGDVAVFARYYTNDGENDIQKSMNEITPWKRNLNMEMSDYAMEYLNIHWYSGGQIRWKYKKLLLEASSYVAANSAVTDITESKWNPTKPFFTQLITVGFYNDLMMLRFIPFVCIGENVLDYGLNGNVDFTTKHNIRIQANSGIKISGVPENIQIDNEIKLGYCLLKCWYLYHSVYFSNKYDFISEKYLLEGKVCGGALFQF